MSTNNVPPLLLLGLYCLCCSGFTTLPNYVDSKARFVLLLAMTVAISPLALDTYLPAFPVMAAKLGVDAHALTLTLTAYVFTLSVAQLIGGPLSDRFGRQPVMLLGLFLFGIASFLIANSESLVSIILLRALQAFGGGWALVCVPALVRDQVSGREAAKLFSMIGLIMVVAPAVAPSVGSLLLKLGGWSSIFVFLGYYAILLTITLKVFLFGLKQRREVAQKDTQNAIHRYIEVLSTRPALRFIFMQSMAFSVTLLFITHSSFIYQEHFQVGPQTFALLFGANIVMMILVNLGNRALLNYLVPRQILRIAASMQLLGLTLLITVLWFTPTLAGFVPAMVLTIGSMGAMAPNNQASCMEYFPKNGGTAAALMGAIQFSMAGLISGLSALLPETVSAIIYAMAACSTIVFMLAWLP